MQGRASAVDQVPGDATGNRENQPEGIGVRKVRGWVLLGEKEGVGGVMVKEEKAAKSVEDEGSSSPKTKDGYVGERK